MEIQRGYFGQMASDRAAPFRAYWAKIAVRAFWSSAEMVGLSRQTWWHLLFTIPIFVGAACLLKELRGAVEANAQMNWGLSLAITTTVALVAIFVINLVTIAPFHEHREQDALLQKRNSDIADLNVQLGRVSHNPALGTAIERRHLSNEAREMLRHTKFGRFNRYKRSGSDYLVSDTKWVFNDTARPRTAERYIAAVEEMCRVGILRFDEDVHQYILNPVGWTLAVEELRDEWSNFSEAAHQMSEKQRSLLQKIQRLERAAQTGIAEAPLTREEEQMIIALPRDLVEVGRDTKWGLTQLGARFVHVAEILARE